MLRGLILLSEILKIKPQLDKTDMQKMERTLTMRFTNIGKKFGKGLGSVLKGGAIAGVGAALIDKLLNPLKEVRDAIEKSLSYSDDLVTNANQFGTTAGNLAKLQAYGQSAGLDSQSLNMLLTKYQTAIAEAAADPNAKSAVRAFAGDTDIADSFFQFIQELQKMNKNDQVLVQKEVFGEKQILKMSDFLNSDFAEVAKYFKGISNEQLTKSAMKTGSLNDLKDTLGAARNLKDINTKAKLINRGTIMSIENSDQLALDKENKRLSNFATINDVNNTLERISGKLEELAVTFVKAIPHMTGLLEGLITILTKIFEWQGMFFDWLKNSKVFKYFSGKAKGE